MMIIGCRVSQVSRFSKRGIPRLYAVESLCMHSAVAEEIHESGE